MKFNLIPDLILINERGLSDECSVFPSYSKRYIYKEIE